MLPSRRWMLLALALTLAAGTSVGVVADRLMLNEDPPPRQSASRSDGTIWFPCYDASAGEDSAEDSADKRAWWDRPAAPQSGTESNSENNGWRQRRLDKLRGELRLDDSQVEQLQGVLHRHGEATRGFWRGTRDQYCGLRDGLRNDVRTLLRAEQVSLFEERLRRLDSKAREGGGRRGRGGDGAPPQGNGPEKDTVKNDG